MNFGLIDADGVHAKLRRASAIFDVSRGRICASNTYHRYSLIHIFLSMVLTQTKHCHTEQLPQNGVNSGISEMAFVEVVRDDGGGGSSEGGEENNRGRGGH